MQPLEAFSLDARRNPPKTAKVSDAKTRCVP